MYTYAQRMKAVDLHLKYEHRVKAVSRELVYPHSNLLSRWYNEYMESGDLKSGYNRGQKYSLEQKCYALQYYEDHDRCDSQTVRALGYPSPFIFRKWLDEAYPNRNRGCAPEGAMVQYPQEIK